MASDVGGEILQCSQCGRKLRVPLLGKELLVTCPSCRYQFSHAPGPHAGNWAETAELPGLVVAGEQAAMWFGLATLGLALVVFVLVGFWLALPLVIALTAVWVWIQQSQLMGGAVKVSARQFPEIHAAAQTAARRLDIDCPDVFVHFSPEINALAIGFLGRKSVVLYSALVEAMTEDELLTIIGHEFTHVKCGHTTLQVLLSPGGGIGVPGVSQVLQLVFLRWSRRAEYTADRGGLLAGRDPKVAVSALCKLAVGPKLFEKMMLMDFIEQSGTLDRNHMARLSEMLLTHPYLVRRLHAVRDFYASDTYRMLAAHRP